MKADAIKEEIERLKTENAVLRKPGYRGVTMRVSEKGALSIYGLSRFPVTLYKRQWLKILDLADSIRLFIEDHEGELKEKV